MDNTQHGFLTGFRDFWECRPDGESIQNGERRGISMKNLLILSDIHANLTALNQVLDNINVGCIDGIILLGDIVDYGPRTNEVISRIKDIPQQKMLVNIWGNHEQAVFEGCYKRFSSDRGRRCAALTKASLSEESFGYLSRMNRQGWQELMVNDKKCLAVHGSLEDVFWKSIDSGNCSELYKEYDYVFSGHSHIPCYMEKFYEGGSEGYRGKKRTVFLNPGSVGQPRNHNPNANFAVLDICSGAVSIHSLEYDYKAEMELFSGQVDVFYRDRLEKGL